MYEQSQGYYQRGTLGSSVQHPNPNPHMNHGTPTSLQLRMASGHTE